MCDDTFKTAIRGCETGFEFYIYPNCFGLTQCQKQLAFVCAEGEDPYALMAKIENAGAIFLGHYSPEPLGDYYAGPNHVLPTSGTARFFSPLSVDDFVKKSSIICCTRGELEKVADQVILLAQKEGLDAHANAVAIRFGKEIQGCVRKDGRA